MKFRFPAVALLAGLTLGLAFAQTPTPLPIPAPVASASVGSSASTTPPAAPAPSTATAWVLMDYASGQVLAGENIHEPLPPASITKVMTAYVVAAELAEGRIKPDDQVLLSERAWREGGAGTSGSFSGFEVNQTARLEDMEKGMAVQSGNDAAIALAEHVAGTQEAFADLMNQHAKRLGMKDSHFVNAHGLTAEGHHASAYDLALLGRALVRDYPNTYAYNSVREFTVGTITQPNRNRLLWRDDSVDGIKTGHTAAAGYCLMSSAQRGDQRLVAVLLGGASERQRADDSLALLNWGFRFFETHRLYSPDQAITTQRVWGGKDNEVALSVAEPVLVSISRGRYEDLKPSMEVSTQLKAPLTAGQQVGTVTVSLDGQTIAKVPLVTLQAVERGGFFKRLWDALVLWWQS